MRLLAACLSLPLLALPAFGQDADELLRKSKAVLSQLDGNIALAGLKEPVEVLRDRWGIAHIYAKNTDDLFFAQGFVAAQDRLFQLDMWRRLGRGEMAEILGPQALEADKFARLIRYRGDMDAEWRSYSPDTKQIATAFTRGINACIDHADGKLPIEFGILGIKPGKWEPEDVLGRMSGIIMSRNFSAEIVRARLINAVGIDRARLLTPTDPPRDFAPLPGVDLTGIDSKVLAVYLSAAKALKIDAPPKSESNNWVIDGTLSASGKPMLASDPHRAITVPSLRYMVHLHAPGWNVIGAGEPALPGVALGHNEKIAWGFTIVGTDQADFFVEEVDPKNPLLYKVGERWEKMKVVTEKIPVQRKAAGTVEVEVELRFTRHGPVLHQDGKRAFALRWAGSEPGGAAYLGSLAVGRAQNRAEFLKALESWKIPSLNFVYADVTGDIGWVAAALTPIRKGWDGLLPVPGAGDLDWQGFLPVKDLPQVWNPAKHWVATANHNILPPGYTKEIAYDWAPPHRYLRIRERLEEKKKFTLEDFKSIQHENTSLPARVLIARLAALKKVDAELEPYVQMMTSWDGVLDRDSRAGPLYAVWLQELTKKFFGEFLAKEAPELVRSVRNLSVVLNHLEKPDPKFFGSSVPGVVRDQIVLTTFKQAVARTRLLLGDDTKTWSWGKVHTVTFRHPLGEHGPGYAQAFNLGPVARPGDGNTPNNTSHDEAFRQVHGASYRHLFDLADWDKSLATSTPGQSGQPGSPHYADLLPLWAEFQYFPLFYSRGKVEEATKHRLKLVP